jgi:hypothetical protein
LHRPQTQARLLRELSLCQILCQPQPGQPLADQAEQRFIGDVGCDLNAPKVAF